MHEAQMTLNDLVVEDPLIRALARAMRDGPGMSLADAVKDVSEIADPDEGSGSCETIAEVAAANPNRSNASGGGRRQHRVVVCRSPSRGSQLARPCEHLGAGWLAGKGHRRSRRRLHQGRRASSEPPRRRRVPLPRPRLGYVQSGKTTNFTAVIAKAADAGYRFFVVLSGVHDALRQQTQDRSERSALGATSRPVEPAHQ